MRLPHHLLRHKSGMWYFRIIVPRDLHAAFGKKVIKRSLGTREPAIARAYAYTTGAQYARAIAEAREELRMGSHGTKDRPISRVFNIQRHDGGNYSVSTNGTAQDNAAGLRALELLTAARPLPQPTTTKPSFTGPTLYQAVEIYGKTDAVGMKPDTWQQRERAFRSFMKVVQPTIRIAHITRPTAAKWAADLQLSGLSKRTVAMMVSHVAQLFDAQIRAGHIERGQNPVKGLVVFKLSDKKAARESGHGWEPVSLDQLKRISTLKISSEPPKSMFVGAPSRASTPVLGWGRSLSCFFGTLKSWTG